MIKTLTSIVALLALLAPAGPVYGQNATATLSGFVLDESGAGIADASVSLINADTSVERQAKANGEGSFTFPFVAPGRYVVKAQHAGFTPGELDNVVVNVGDNLNLRMALKVGSVQETVNVIAQASRVQESGTVGTVINREFAANLPLNGRTFQSLIALTPGAVTVQSEITRQGQFSVNGQRATSNYFTVDGVSANAGVTTSIVNGRQAAGIAPVTGATGGMNNLVSVDAMQEFTIQTSTFAPEFGRTPGAQVSVVTRSGTNALHGTLFDYFRNDAMDANDWFANRDRLRKPPLRQNQFGGVLGGPVIKIKTFFFFSYEGLRLRLPQVRTASVPSVSMRQEAAASLQPVVNAYPVPNGATFADGLAQFSASYSDSTTLDAASLRIDHAVNSKLTVFGRYNYAPSDAVARRSVMSDIAYTTFETQTATGGATYSVTPRLSNEVRANFTTNSVRLREELDSFGGATAPSESALFPSFMSSAIGSFSFRVATSESLFPGKWPGSSVKQINLVDNLSFITGSHQLKAGFDYRHLLPRSDPHSFRFDVVAANLAGVRSGIPSSMVVIAYQPVVLTFRNFSTYLQDTWRVSPRVTLTYGFRWEVNPPPSGRDGTEFVSLQGADNLGTATLKRNATPYQTTYNNFGPRVGISYRLRQTARKETVVRGGFGVFHDLGGSQGPSSSNFPYVRRFTAPTNTPFGPGQVSAPAALSFDPPYQSLIWTPDPNLKLGYVLHYNVTVEQLLGVNQLVSAAYAGASGRDLIKYTRVFGPNPRFITGAVVEIATNGTSSNYNSLQLQYQRRFSRGFQALASYIWSHSIDTDSGDSNSALPSLSTMSATVDRGPSTYDVRHSLTGALSYSVPAPFAGGFLKAVFRDFAIDSIFKAQTAPPISVFSSRDIGFGSYNFRPDQVLGVPVYIDDPNAPGGWRVNRAAFDAATPAAQSRLGTLGRNSLRAFGVSQIDLALRRQFRLSERITLQARGELFNIFNHPNFGAPTTNLTGNPFGQSTTMLSRSLTAGTGGTGTLSSLYQIGGPRSAQLGLKLQF